MHAEDTTAEAVLAAYANGQRLFSRLALPDGVDLSGCCLEGACFQDCFITNASLKGTNLRGTAFRRCNLKCSDLDDADLTNALIEQCSIDCVSALRCRIDGLSVLNCGAHSSTDLGLEDFIDLAVTPAQRPRVAYIMAQITFKPHDQGGRPCMPVGSGYAPYLRTPLVPADLEVRVKDIPANALFGQAIIVKLELSHFPRLDYGLLNEEVPILLIEGPKIIAEGVCKSSILR